MREITIAEIEKATGGKLICGSPHEKIFDVCIDSRKAKAGDLFVPIIGEVHDAHKFIPQVLESGCKTVMVSREDAVKADESLNIILTDDTTKAIQALSAYYLKTLNLKTIAVTGSVGKTSTRDMVYYILSEKFKTGTTIGNFNNDIGVPLTIFTFDDSMEAAVLEVGMDHAGEIHRLVDIIRPNIGIITNVGMSHIENLGSREGILAAKLEITDYFGPENTLVINHANDMLAGVTCDGEYKVVKTGVSPEDEYYIHNVEDFGEEGIAFVLRTGGRDYPVRLGIPGAHNALNAALAVAACSSFGVTVEEATAGLLKLQLTGKRLTVKEAGGIKVIDDTYNAAPDSMKSAIRTLMNTKGSRKTAILGGMNELGADSAKYHREVGIYAAQQNVDILITVEEKAKDIAAGFNETAADKHAIHFDTKDDLYKELEHLLKAGDTVLVKASRGLEMEQVVARIIKEQE